MGDVFKILKDKRHRSSSSLAGALLESTRSERKLDMNVSIPEVDDQFAVAASRCDDLQEKIKLIQSIKRKKKLRKRSTTKVMDQPQTSDHIPCISVRTYPKKKVSQQEARMRRFDIPTNPTRGYLDPATVEQHRMIGQVHGYNNTFNQPHQERNKTQNQSNKDQKIAPKSRLLRRPESHAEGDYSGDQGVIIKSEAVEAACGQDDDYKNYYEECVPNVKLGTRKKGKLSSGRRQYVSTDNPAKEDADLWQNDDEVCSPNHRTLSAKNHTRGSSASQVEERPVVELFNKRFGSPPLERKEVDPLRKTKKIRPKKQDIMVAEDRKETHHSRRVKNRSHGYELPTVASQMKQAGVRYYYDNCKHSKIPFVVSKSTAPSHNIGVNIQQVLNGLKMQQPLSGIPLTIAHHMGLSHVPVGGAKSATLAPELEQPAINAIKVGKRLLRLPSYKYMSHKYMSYKRLLSMYREGDGMVPRFLKSINRPHYFYTSMYNLATHHEDFDGATSKGHAASQEAKQNIAEFANLYREYENLNKNTKDGQYEPEIEHRKEELSRELAAREQQLRKVLQDYRSPHENDQSLRASASTAEDTYRHLKYKVVGDIPQ